MTAVRIAEFYGAGFPYSPIDSLPGRLIVLEGPDGVGRSSQIAALRQWLEEQGYGVSDTGLARSELTAPGLDTAKAGHTISTLCMSLFYATDFADRLENQIIPALKAGFIVLSDRYFYSTLARDIVRGVDPEWAKSVYGFALKPDAIFYLRAGIDTLVSRMVHGRGLNYWESGMDMHLADNLYDCFVLYQSRMLDQFETLATQYGFTVIDADQEFSVVQDALRQQIMPIIESM